MIEKGFLSISNLYISMLYAIAIYIPLSFTLPDEQNIKKKDT